MTAALLSSIDLVSLRGYLLTGAFVLIATVFLLGKNAKASSVDLKDKPRGATETKRRREITKCPFSNEAAFIQETTEHLPPSPLDLYEDWVDHLATRWLAAGLSGQDTPGFLRAGLKRLRHSRHFLVEEPHRIKEELLLKKKNLDDPALYDEKFVAEEQSLDAQLETLQLFVAYLPDRYPEMYSYNKQEHSITVHPIETTFYIHEWMDRPLELCERIVQEDLILMRPGPALEDAKHGSEGYYMSAAAVCFSFNKLEEKLGKPAEFLHAPVPGYEHHLRKTMNMMFSKLKVEQPLWRNNWGIAPTGTLDEPLYGSDEARESRKMNEEVTEQDVKSMFLKVEYQTIRRLPRSGYLLFTVKTMVDGLDGLEHVPAKAAKCLAASIRGMSKDMRAYKGIENEQSCVAVLKYLDSVGN